MKADENLYETDNIPVKDSPSTKDTIILSDDSNIHHDSWFGTKGIEYFKGIKKATEVEVLTLSEEREVKGI